MFDFVFHLFCQYQCTRILSGGRPERSSNVSNPRNHTTPLITRKCSRKDHPGYREYHAEESKAQSHRG
jgi:hypothetical protein